MGHALELSKDGEKKSAGRIRSMIAARTQNASSSSAWTSRRVDVILVDGVDVLFRVAFGILRMNEQELLHCTSVPAVYVALESLPNRMWQPDKLLSVRIPLIFNQLFGC